MDLIAFSNNAIIPNVVFYAFKPRGRKSNSGPQVNARS